MPNERATDADGRLVEEVVDHGDGTGTRTTYGPDGEVTATVSLTGLPVAPADPAAAITAARASLAAATTLTQVRSRTIALFDLLDTQT